METWRDEGKTKEGTWRKRREIEVKEGRKGGNDAGRVAQRLEFLEVVQERATTSTGEKKGKEGKEGAWKEEGGVWETCDFSDPPSDAKLWRWVMLKEAQAAL